MIGNTLDKFIEAIFTVATSLLLIALIMACIGIVSVILSENLDNGFSIESCLKGVRRLLSGV
jgi:hypothetical protein